MDIIKQYVAEQLFKTTRICKVCQNRYNKGEYTQHKLTLKHQKQYKPKQFTEADFTICLD